MPYGLVGRYQGLEKHTVSICRPEDRGSMFLRNIVILPKRSQRIPTQMTTIDICVALSTSDFVACVHPVSFSPVCGRKQLIVTLV
jgi:hypothetical protein